MRNRLDSFLAKSHPKLSRTEIKRLIERGLVRVDGVPRKPSFPLKGGESIELRFRPGPRPEKQSARPEPIPLDILYEDDELLVLNKPAGLIVHPAAGNYSGTLVNAILYHFHNTPRPPLTLRGGDAELRPGIVHRLDKGTSGVMVVAKTDIAQRNLANQFKNRQVKKTYLALVFGSFLQKEGILKSAIGRDPYHRRKFSSRARHKREAVTRYRVVQEFHVGAHRDAPLQKSVLSLLEVHPETGRTHQIRVHLSEAHHPIVGDTHYGARSYLSSIKEEDVRNLLASLDRPFLHAAHLEFRHPAKGREMVCLAPCAEDLSQILSALQPFDGAFDAPNLKF